MKCRIIKRGNIFYPQKKGWFFWNFFETGYPIATRVHFHNFNDAEKWLFMMVENRKIEEIKIYEF